MDPRVLDTMLPYLTDQYGNPHSRTHAYGWEAEKAVDDARKVSSFPYMRPLLRRNSGPTACRRSHWRRSEGYCFHFWCYRIQ